MFREKIRGHMYETGISVKRLSEETGIKQCTISSFLSGGRAISNENLDAILDKLGLTLVSKQKFHLAECYKSRGKDDGDEGGR